MSDLQDMIHTSTMRAHKMGAARERERIIKYLTDKGILRQGMFIESGLVARMVDTQAADVWPIIDLPADLGADE
jgi:hypothetical protein